jgi:ferredoxin
MNLENTTLLYFSPTATTQTILKEITKGLAKNVSNAIDITKPEIRTQPSPGFGNDLVLIGAPVYGGRLPKDAVDYFKTLKAKGTPAVLVVLYGNREFEDALIELKNIAIDCGFVPLAAAAFIGEHSFSNDEFSIAPNRPDKDDLEKAFSFGEQITGLLNGVENPTDLIPVDVPGNFPYKQDFSMGPFAFIDVTDDCDDCGICAIACPKNAIDEENGYSTLDEHCIYCCACIKACPQSARILKNGPIKDKAKKLSEVCAQRKEPQTFLPDK